MKTLSVAIIALNEEANIGRTLASVIDACDEVVLVDNGSTDCTLEIARTFGPKVRIIHEPWRGFAGQKNFSIEQCTGEWVLSLDADEAVSPELAASLRETIETATVDAISVNRRLIFLGRWIWRAGLYPDPKIRLIRRGKAWFEERPVHESIHFAGPTAKAKGDLLHWAYHDLDNFIEAQNRYSSLGATLIKPRKARRLFVNAVIAPFVRFVYDYFLRLGFLDGYEGMLWHIYHAVYTSLKYSKAWERERRAKN
jgi:glycosyltransferase involved in cell wall biosynthesis